MSLLEDLLVGERIAAVHADSEVTYVMLTSGSQITIHGLVRVEPPPTIRAERLTGTQQPSGQGAPTS